MIKLGQNYRPDTEKNDNDDTEDHEIEELVPDSLRLENRDDELRRLT